MTLLWPVPPGRVESYTVSWFPVSEGEAATTTKLIAGDEADTGAEVVSVLVDNLRPGLEYQVRYLRIISTQYLILSTNYIYTIYPPGGGCHGVQRAAVSRCAAARAHPASVHQRALHHHTPGGQQHIYKYL